MNVYVETLSFEKDGAIYHGQVWNNNNIPIPHGYGRMINKNQYIIEGYFINGKVNGFARLVDPQDNIYYGEWKNHKRYGRGIQYKRGERLCLLETYDNEGKLIKRLKRAEAKLDRIHWKIPVVLSELPPNLCGHTSSLVNNQMIVFGGFSNQPDGKEIDSNEMWSLHVDSMSWHRVAPKSNNGLASDMPPPLHGHTATVVGHKIYVIGGCHGMEVFSSVYCFDTKSEVWSCVVKKGVNMTQHKSVYYAAQNSIISFIDGTPDVYALKLDNMEWEQLAINSQELSKMRNRAPALRSPDMIILEDLVFIFGGKLPTVGASEDGYHVWEKCNTDIFVLNLEKKSWSIVENIAGYDTSVIFNASGASPSDSYGSIVGSSSALESLPNWQTPRCEHTVTFVPPHYVYVIGGLTTVAPKVNVIDTTHLHDVQVFDLSKSQWVPVLLLDRFFTPRSLHTSVYTENQQIICFGGYNYANPSLNELVVLNCGASTIYKSLPVPSHGSQASISSASVTTPGTESNVNEHFNFDNSYTPKPVSNYTPPEEEQKPLKALPSKAGPISLQIYNPKQYQDPKSSMPEVANFFKKLYSL